MNKSDKSALPGFPRKGKFTTKDEIDQYFSDPDRIQCLLCGHVFETLNGHLQVDHECSYDEYRSRYGLP
jgi:predicted transcriptional regulator